MLDPYDPNPAAVLLAAAWRSGELLPELPADCRPKSLDEGYDVQDRLMALIGDGVVGWKLGVGSPNAKAQAGTARSIAGRILRSRLFAHDQAVPMPNRAPVTIEFEIAFILGRDIVPGEKIDDPLSIVSATHVAFEFVQARFVDRRTVGWPSFAADNSGFSALVFGPIVDASRIGAIATSLTVAADRKDMATAATGLDAIDPVMALREMLDHACERQLTLLKGMIISTGTMSQPFNTSGEPTIIAARFEGGTLAARTIVRA